MEKTVTDHRPTATRSFSGQTPKEAQMNTDAITIRRSTDADRLALLRLAQLDEQAPPEGDALLAFVDGDLRAALPLRGDRALADPFHPSRDVVEMLRVLAHQGAGGAPRSARPVLNALRLVPGRRVRSA
jgi:hypothetical protein